MISFNDFIAVTHKHTTMQTMMIDASQLDLIYFAFVLLLSASIDDLLFFVVVVSRWLVG